MSRIVSSLAGRIRIRDKKLCDPERIDRLKSELSKIAAVTELQGNICTGSVLVNFDRNAISLSAMEATVESALDKVMGKAPKPEPLLSKKNVNRYNKILMFVTMGASILALAITRRRDRIFWHKVTGYAFLVNLGVHFWIYRKSVQRTFQW